MNKEPGQLAYEAWVEAYETDRKLTPWGRLEPRMKEALAHQEQVIREAERRKVVEYLRVNAVQTHKVDAIEAGKHLGGGDE